ADAEAIELAQILASSSPADATARITGLAPDHPLFAAVSTLVEERQAEGAKAPA
ncbi:MAG TPA: mannitol-1-phosphate 5-dehydrogenase, partial [Arthrobacter bacterium]|nr:mannitol-1-phosphate 5-dehydrogenase [Arthrobacter sp.]